MARSAQYSPGRRIVMQVAMAGILIATVGLAAIVRQVRAGSNDVELSAKPHLTDGLSIHLPKGWTVSQDNFTFPLAVTALPPKAIGLEAREILVYQAIAPTRDATLLLSQFLSNSHGQIGRIRPFEMMGQQGILVRYDREQPVMNDPMGRGTTVPGWYAAGVIPNAGPGGVADLVVILGAEGFRTAGPAGERLLRQIADGLATRSN